MYKIINTPEGITGKLTLYKKILMNVEIAIENIQNEIEFKM